MGGDSTSTISDAGATLVECQSRLASHQTDVERLSQSLADAEVDCSNAEASKQESDAVLRTAKFQVSALEMDIKQRTSDLSAANNSMLKFEDGPMPLFWELKSCHASPGDDTTICTSKLDCIGQIISDVLNEGIRNAPLIGGA